MATPLTPDEVERRLSALEGSAVTHDQAGVYAARVTEAEQEILRLRARLEAGETAYRDLQTQFSHLMDMVKAVIQNAGSGNPARKSVVDTKLGQKPAMPEGDIQEKFKAWAM